VKYQSFSNIDVDGNSFKAISFDKVNENFALDRLPYCIKILLENLLRHETEEFVTSDDIEQDKLPRGIQRITLSMKYLSFLPA